MQVPWEASQVAIITKMLNANSSFISSSPISIGLGACLGVYLIWKFMSWVHYELRTWYYYRQLPGFNYISWIGQTVLGTMELYLYSMSHLTREKAFTQLLIAFHQIDYLYQAGFGRATIGAQRIVALYRQDTVEKFITSMEYIDKSVQYAFFDTWLGFGLLTSTGDKWKKHRKLLTPAFHFKILDSFFPIMNDNTEIMMDRFDEEILESGSLDIRSFLADCTLDTICETAMGTTVGAQDRNSDIDYIDPLNKALRLMMRRVANPLLQNNYVYQLMPQGRLYESLLNNKIHSFVLKVIQERKDNLERSLHDNNVNIDSIGGQELETFTKKRYAFLDSLLLTHLKNPKEFTMKDIQDEVNTFMFEGHDTTSMSLIFTILLVAGDPRVQKKIQEELDAIYQEDFKRQITLEDTRHMKYLEMVIKESLRLYPSVPFYARKLNQDVQVEDKIVPAGVTLVFVAYLLHRNKEVFPQPEKFLPERFESDAKIHKMPYAYIPFSAGPRNCIGQKFAMLEMKIILASLLRKYNMSAVTQRDELDINFSIIIKSDTPVNISFKKRDIFE